MTKYSDKNELVRAIESEHARLDKTLDAIPRKDMSKPGVVGTWSVKDMLAHLTAWEQLLLDWYADGINDRLPVIAPVGMSKNAIRALNQDIHARNHKRPLAAIGNEFHSSYQQTLSTVQTIRAKDLFSKWRFRWTGELLLADYVAGNTCNHYYWANSHLRKWQKEQSASTSSSHRKTKTNMQGVKPVMQVQDHRRLALWAAACAERALPCFEKISPEDNRPRTAIAAARAWARGEIKMSDARRAAFASHAAARAVKHAAARAAARAAGHAAATAHVPAHARHAARYALDAVSAEDNSAKAGGAEKAWQERHLPRRLRAAALPYSEDFRVPRV